MLPRQVYIVPSLNLGEAPRAGDPSGVIEPMLEGLAVRYGVEGDKTGDLVPTMLDGDPVGSRDERSD